MLQRWVDHNGNEHQVRDRYEANKQLIDLTAQPDDIKALLDEAIGMQVQKDSHPQVGLHLLKFCGKWNLAKISDDVKTHSTYLSTSYA